MEIAVLGCGGIGGVLAANLTRAGQPVTPITGNPAIAQAIGQHGYRVRELDGGSWSVAPSRPPLVAAGDEAVGRPRRFDLVLLATQSTTLETALASVRPYLADGAGVVCCQNGLPEDRAARVVGPHRVLGCVVGWGASMVEPGHYRRTSRGGLTLGRPHPEAPDPAAVASLLEAASQVRIVDDLQAVRWSKLAINCVTTTIGAVGGDTLGRLLRHRFVRRLALEVFGEVVAVARGAGIRPAPVNGTLDIERVAISPAERRLRLGSPSLFFKHSLLVAVGLRFRRLRSSMLYALERGRPPEIDFLNGELVRRGASLGVATPVNGALVDAVRGIAAGERRSGLGALRQIYGELGLGQGGSAQG